MTRRGQNEGSIHQRKDGRWTAVINLGYKNGKRARKYLYGDTRREVSEKLKVALRDQQLGIPVSIERQTVGQFLDHWLDDVVRSRVRPSTHESYALHVRNYLKPALGRVQLAALSPQHVQTLINDQIATGLSPRTVQYMRAILRSALNQALKWGLVTRNVATLVEPPRSRRPEIRPLTPDQVRILLDTVKDDRLGALFTLAVSLGLRQGEALGLRWDDVDLESGVLRIRHTIQKVNGEWRFAEPKSDRSRRTITMPTVTVASLRQHRVRIIEEQRAAGKRWQDWNLVFPSTVGTPMDGPNVTHRLQKILEGAGLPRQRFHDLRHCCASMLLVQKVPMRVVMEILGHSQISLTMDTYSHVMPALQNEAADLMDAMLKGNL